MKTDILKKCAWASAAVLVAAAMPSCSNEDEQGVTAGYGKVASSAPPVANAGIQFPVTGVYNSSYPEYLFAYDNGRMIRALNDYDEEFVFNSNPLTIRVIYTPTYADYTAEGEYKNIIVNNDGFITSCDVTYSDYDGDETYTEYMNVNVAYDSDGHMVLEKYKVTDNEGYEETGTVTYAWENGNLMKVEWSYAWSEDGESDEGVDIEQMTYDSDEERYPNPGVWHFFSSSVASFGWCFDDTFLYAGLLGKTTKSIPLTISTVEDGNYRTSDRITGVSYNDDGSVNRIYQNNSYVSYGYNQTWDADWNLVSSRTRLGEAESRQAVKPMSRIRKRMQERKAEKRLNMLNINE